MMKIAINILPLKNAHKLRGIGYYTSNLVEQLKKDPDVQLVEFTDPSLVKDVDLIHYPWFDFFFHTLGVRKKIPTVVTIHDAIPLKFSSHYPSGLRGKINLYLQKLALKNCKTVITDSQASKKDISKYLNFSEKKITVIPLAVNNFTNLSENKLLYVKRKYNLPDQFLLYVGDANWVKNIPFLIEGFNQISKIPEFKNLKLVLVRDVFLKKLDNIDHPELASLKRANKMIEEFNLSDKVIRPGNLEEEELIAFYNLATIYIQPSIYEGFGLPVLQALTCGVPVVSSSGGSLPEVAGEAAIYFDPNNLNQFTTIVKDVLENKSLQDKLSKLAIKQAKFFSWNKVKEDTKKVYLKALQK